MGESIRYGWGGDAMVLQIDEAGVLEALEYGFGGCLFR
jgi:hypothetical protein